MGLNLPDKDGNHNDPLESTEAVATIVNGVDAIFYTHFHGDHVGLSEYVPAGIPQYVGEMAKEIMLVKLRALSKDTSLTKSMLTYRAAHKVQVGDISVTPFFVSHSAADAYMFLIEADGKKVLHSGDFREHGYLGKGLMPTLEKYVGEVDVLITEGTMLSRMSEQMRTENQLKLEAAKLMKQYKYVFVVGSSTDMERLASFHKATPKGRHFVCDRYQKNVLDIFTATSGQRKDLFDFSTAKPCLGQKFVSVEMLRKGFCMLVRPNGYKTPYMSYVNYAIDNIPDADRLLIYSMWDGYLDKDENRNEHHVAFLSKFKNVVRLHTSGHASAETLAKVCTFTNPSTAIIPIHSEKSDEFRNLPISEELQKRVVAESISCEGLEIVIKQLHTDKTISN